MLRVVWNQQLGEIHLQLMGQVQLEVLRRLLQDRFGLEASFGAGSIVYRETIAAPVEGVGHFEPLRHYAEVHLLLEPGQRGSGVQVASACPTDRFGSELAAAGAHPPAGAAAPRGAHRVPPSPM